MAFQDSYTRPDVGGINAAKHRADAAIAGQLAVITKVLDASVTSKFEVSDRWVYFNRGGVRYAVAAKLLNL